jgi:hypothetical protein
MTIPDLNKKFSQNFIAQWRPMMLLTGQDGIDYVHGALEASIQVIGIEGFHLLPDGSIQPDMRLEVGAQHCTDSMELRSKVLEVLETCKDDKTVVFEIYLEGN